MITVTQRFKSWKAWRDAMQHAYWDMGPFVFNGEQYVGDKFAGHVFKCKRWM